MDAGTITWTAAYASVLIALFILIRQRKRLAERMREAHSELIAEMREANGQLSGANSGVEGRDTPLFEPRL